jgi:hypothetical protein
VTWDPAFFPSDVTSLVLGADANADSNNPISVTNNTSQRSFTSSPFTPRAGAYSFVVGSGLVASNSSATPVTLFLASFADNTDDTAVAQQQRVAVGPVLQIVASRSDMGSKIWLLKIVLPIVLGVLIIVGLMGWLLYRRRKRGMGMSTGRGVRMQKEPKPGIMSGKRKMKTKKGVMVRKSTIRRLGEDEYLNMSNVEMGMPPMARLPDGPRRDGGNVFRDELRRQESGPRR